MERIPEINIEKNTEAETYIPPEIEDFKNRSFFPLLRRINPELLQRHLIHIDTHDYSDEEAVAYIEDIIETRAEALTETVISDATLLEKIKDRLEGILHQIETSVFNDPENLIGAGMTARIKSFLIEDPQTNESLPVAVKYLITPTSMTLSASSEHDMVLEVERIQAIEAIEADAGLTMIKVPHPYFHHKNSEIQCYGMELIDGFDLSKDLAGMRNGEAKNHLLERLAAIDESILEKEIRTFYGRMHNYCLHGDMKPANMMVDRNGMFYIIDFGQSRLVMDIPDTAREQLYTLQDDEIKISLDAARRVVREAKQILADK
jgi:tRNA A-37 threonylcarbamoyl transferase component Bud32